jgi:hypothetical protein
MICELLEGNVPNDIGMFEQPFFSGELVHE